VGSAARVAIVVVSIFAVASATVSLACGHDYDATADAVDGSSDASSPDVDAAQPDDDIIDLADALAPTDAAPPGLDCGVSGTSALAFDPIGAGGTICNEQAAITTDGIGAGLAMSNGGAGDGGSVDGRTVGSCIVVNFPDGNPLQRALVRVGATASACGLSCTTQCGTGHNLYVFAGNTVDTYKYSATLAVSRTLGTFVVDLPEGGPREVVVCRPNYGYTRDMIVLDSVVGCR